MKFISSLSFFTFLFHSCFSQDSITVMDTRSAEKTPAGIRLVGKLYDEVTLLVIAKIYQDSTQ